MGHLLPCPGAGGENFFLGVGKILAIGGRVGYDWGMTTTYRSIRMICICLTLIILMILAGRGDGGGDDRIVCGKVYHDDATWSRNCWKVTPQEDDLVSSID